MNRNVMRGLLGAAFVGGLWAAGTAVASAADVDESSHDSGAASTIVQLPVTIAGNAVGGDDASTTGADTSSTAASTADAATASSDASSGSGGILSGGSSAAIVSLPITVSGNAVSVAGDSTSEGATTSVAAPAESTSSSGSSDGTASDGSSAAIVSAPITVSGNALSVLGDAHSEDATTTVEAPATAESHATGSESSWSDDEGLLSGGSSAGIVSAPITVSGNAVSVLGDAHSEDASTSVEAPATAESHATGSSDDESLLSNGSSAVATAAPITIAGNAVAVTGDAHSEGALTEVHAPARTESHSTGASDDEGLLSGGSSAIGTSAPVTIGGNAVSGTGDAYSQGAETAVEAPAAATSNAAGSTDGESLLSNGSSAIATAAPITIGGNAVAVTGDAWSEGAETTVEAPAIAESHSTGSSDDEGLLSGGSSAIGTSAPITIGGNAVSGLGDAHSEGAATEVHAPAWAESHAAGSSDDEGLLSGGSSAIGTSAPITIGGNAVSGLGDAHSEGAVTWVEAPAEATSQAAGSSDDEGLLSGGSSAITTAAPITIGGNAVAVTGDAVSEGAETTVVAPATATSNGTSTDEGILGGGTSTIETVAPVTIGGNAVSVLGDATTTGSTTTVITEPTVPTEPSVPTEPMTPSEPTDPGTDTPSTGGPTTDAPTTGEAPAGITPAVAPTVPEKADAAVSDSATSPASLPVTGAELGGLALGIALAAMLLGLLLVLGARMRTRLQR